MDFNIFGKPSHKVSAFYLHFKICIINRYRRSDFNFYVFGGAVSDRKVVGSFYMVRDRGIKFIACYFYGGSGYNSSQRNNRNIGGSPTDIHHHMPRGLIDRNSGTYGGQNRFFYHIGGFCPRLHRRLNHGSAFGGSNTRGNRNHNLGAKKPDFSGSFVYKIAKHRLGYTVIGNHSIAKGPIGHDSIGGTAYHISRFVPHRQNGIVNFGDGNYGRLVYGHASLGNKHQSVGSPEIN